MPRERKPVCELREGEYVVIDRDEPPYEITRYRSRNGAVDIEAISVFDEGGPRRLRFDATDEIWVPTVERRQGQVVTISENDVQVLDLDTYETFTTRSSQSDELSPDDEVEYLEYDDPHSGIQRGIIRSDGTDQRERRTSGERTVSQPSGRARVYDETGDGQSETQIYDPGERGPTEADRSSTEKSRTGGDRQNYCSSCGGDLGGLASPEYCPNCGDRTQTDS